MLRRVAVLCMFVLLTSCGLPLLLMHGRAYAATATTTTTPPTMATSTANTPMSTPMPLSEFGNGPVISQMGAVSSAATSLSMTPTGMMILAAGVLISAFEAVWFFVGFYKSR